MTARMCRSRSGRRTSSSGSPAASPRARRAASPRARRFSIRMRDGARYRGGRRACAARAGPGDRCLAGDGRSGSEASDGSGASLRRDVLDLALDEPVDAIVSTATLHWVSDHDMLWPRTAAALRSSEILEAQCGPRQHRPCPRGDQCGRRRLVSGSSHPFRRNGGQTASRRRSDARSPILRHF